MTMNISSTSCHAQRMQQFRNDVLEELVKITPLGKPPERGPPRESITRFVDDLTMGTTKDRTKKKWEEIEHEGVELETGSGKRRIEDGQRHVGIVVKRYVMERDDNGNPTLYLITLSQSEFLRSVCDEFYSQYGLTPRRKYTPAPAAPKCYGPEKVPTEEEWKEIQQRLQVKGRFADSSLHYTNSIAYAEQGSRPDLSVVVNLLQRFGGPATFNEEADALLKHTMDYIHTHHDYELCIILDPRDVDLAGISPQGDSSVADDPKRRRSTRAPH